MSTAHRRLTRTAFTNRRPLRCGYHVSWGEGQSSTMQAWYVDEAGAARLRTVLAERGGWSKFKRVRSIGIDFGGFLCMDRDDTTLIHAGGYQFKLWEHQRGDLLDVLKRVNPATDCPSVVVLPGSWWRVFLAVDVAASLRAELEKQRDEAARQLAQRDQHVAGVREQINKKLDAKGITTRIVW